MPKTRRDRRGGANSFDDAAPTLELAIKDRPKGSESPSVASRATAGDKSPRRSALRSMVTRAAMLPLTLSSNLIATRLVLDGYGTSGFATYTLIVTLPTLLPVADLGIGAAVTDAVARRAAHGRRRLRTSVRRAMRTLSGIGAAVCAVAAALRIFGFWPTLVGSEGQNVSSSATAALCAFGCSLPFALGLRMLMGLRKNEYVIVLQGIAIVCSTIAMTLVVVVFEAPLWVAVTLPFLTNGAAGAAGFAMASRELRREPLPKPRGAESGRRDLKSVAGPMAVITASLPLAFQSDRLVLSQVLGLGPVAVYSAGAQVFTPGLSIITAASQSLWAEFAQLRHNSSEAGKSLVHTIRTFTLVACVIGLSMAAFGGLVVNFVTGSQINVPTSLMAGFGTLLLAQAVQLPLGQFLTSPENLKFQAKLSIAMVLVNIPTSILLAKWVGVAGPVFGSAISVTVCSTLPCALRAYSVCRADPPRSDRTVVEGNLIQGEALRGLSYTRRNRKGRY